MTLEKKINDDIKAAMLARDKKKLEALRAVKSALLLAKTGKGISGGEIPGQVEMSILQKLVKQRKESAGIFKSQNRNDLADVELFQASIIENYLPKQISKKELHKIIEKIISENGASSIKEMGIVMGVATKQLAGKADNKTIAAIVKQILGR